MWTNRVNREIIEKIFHSYGKLFGILKRLQFLMAVTICTHVICCQLVIKLSFGVKSTITWRRKLSRILDLAQNELFRPQKFHDDVIFPIKTSPFDRKHHRHFRKFRLASKRRILKLIYIFFEGIITKKLLIHKYSEVWKTLALFI